MCVTDRKNVDILKTTQDLADVTFVCQQTSNVLMQNFKALFRDKLIEFRDVITMKIFMLISISSTLDVVDEVTSITDDSFVVGVEAFQVEIQMTLRAKHPALFFISSFLSTSYICRSDQGKFRCRLTGEAGAESAKFSMFEVQFHLFGGIEV